MVSCLRGEDGLLGFWISREVKDEDHVGEVVPECIWWSRRQQQQLDEGGAGSAARQQRIRQAAR